MTLPALRVVEAEYRNYRRTWRGSIISTFLNPVLFLAAMGVGLGSLVDRGSGQAELAIPFVSFVATGLLAASAMQTGFGEGAWPVLAGIKWRKTFDAVLATPVGVSDMVSGMLAWGAVRLTFATLVYGLVAVTFGAIDILPLLLVIPAAVLTGSAFHAATFAMTAGIEDETVLSNTFRFVVLPLFLFSGTFFPVSQLPGWMAPIAMVTPLYHGVELVRRLALPALEAPMVGTIALPIHAVYLVAMLGLGWWLAVRRLDSRIRK